MRQMKPAGKGMLYHMADPVFTVPDSQDPAHSKVAREKKVALRVEGIRLSQGLRSPLDYGTHSPKQQIVTELNAGVIVQILFQKVAENIRNAAGGWVGREGIGQLRRCYGKSGLHGRLRIDSLLAQHRVGNHRAGIGFASGGGDGNHQSHRKGRRRGRFPSGDIIPDTTLGGVCGEKGRRLCRVDCTAAAHCQKEITAFPTDFPGAVPHKRCRGICHAPGFRYDGERQPGKRLGHLRKAAATCQNKQLFYLPSTKLLFKGGADVRRENIFGFCGKMEIAIGHGFLLYQKVLRMSALSASKWRLFSVSTERSTASGMLWPPA